MSAAELLPPVPPPPSHKDRRRWLIAFGIFEILIGCLVLLLMAFIIFELRHITPNQAGSPPDMRAFAFMNVFYGLIAVAFVCIGIGSMRARQWARIAMLIVSWTWLAVGVISIATLAVLMPMIMSNAQQQAATPMPAGVDSIARAVMFVVVGLFFIIMPLVFILFYSSKHVKATCRNTSPSTMPDKPVAVWIASGWCALGALGYLAVLMRSSIPLLGVILNGWAALLAAAAMETIMIWLALNLYRQRELAWKVAIGWTLFGLVSMFATVSRMGFDGMYRAMGYSEKEMVSFYPFVRYFYYLGALTAAAFIIFLLAMRKHFRIEPPAKQVI